MCTIYEVLYRELLDTCTENVLNHSSRTENSQFIFSNEIYKYPLSNRYKSLLIRFSISFFKNSLLAMYKHYANDEMRSPLKRRLQLCTHPFLGSHCVASALDTDPPASHNLSRNISQIASLSLFASCLLFEWLSWCPVLQPLPTIVSDENLDKE